MIELPDGKKVEFNGEFTEEEHAFLIEFALANLISRGLLPVQHNIGVIQ